MGVKITTTTNSYWGRTASLPGSQAVTACGWARISSVGNGSGGNFAQLWGMFSSGGAKWMQIGYTGGNLCVTTDAASAGVPQAFASNPSLNAWFFWYVLAGATNMDAGWTALGSPGWVTKSITSSNFAAVEMSHLGDSFGEYLYGEVSGTKIWGAAMTQAQMELELFSKVPKNYASPHLWSPFPSNSDIKDHFSGTGRDWTANGAGTADGEDPPVFFGAQASIYAKAGAGADTGSLAITADTATLAMAGNSTVSGTLAINGDGTVAMAGTTTVFGTLAINGDGQVAMSGTTNVAGALAIASDTATVSILGGSGNTGDLVIAADTAAVAMAGTLTTPGTLGITADTATVAMAGTTNVPGTLGITADSATVAMAGTTNVPGALAISATSATVSILGAGAAATTDDDDFFLVQ